MKRILLLVLCALFAFQGTTNAQRKKNKKEEPTEAKLPLQAFKSRNQACRVTRNKAGRNARYGIEIPRDVRKTP